MSTQTGLMCTYLNTHLHTSTQYTTSTHEHTHRHTYREKLIKKKVLHGLFWGGLTGDTPGTCRYLGGASCCRHAPGTVGLCWGTLGHLWVIEASCIFGSRRSLEVTLPLVVPWGGLLGGIAWYPGGASGGLRVFMAHDCI